MPFPHRKFRQHREKLGLTREQVGDRSNLTARYIEALEQGRKPNPTQETIEGLCAALGVKCDFFFSDDIPESQAPKRLGRPRKLSGD